MVEVDVVVVEIVVVVVVVVLAGEAAEVDVSVVVVVSFEKYETSLRLFEKGWRRLTVSVLVCTGRVVLAVCVAV